MPNYYATAALYAANGVARDVQINTFAVASDTDLSTTQSSAWAGTIQAFYQKMHTDLGLGGRALTDHAIKMLAADGSVPNYPIYNFSFNLQGTAQPVGLPLEVSLCVSYANTDPSSIPRARRRGRIYLSGFPNVANLQGRPTALACNTLLDAYSTYVVNTNTIAGITAGIWSRRNAAVYPITDVWVDDEWDTMRSRGGRATQRFEEAV